MTTFRMMRMRRADYNKLKELKALFEEKPEYSYVKSLSLGAFIGFMLTWMGFKE